MLAAKYGNKIGLTLCTKYHSIVYKVELIQSFPGIL